jgi:BlaI family transcriptional regulator, penicillinase repressor
MTNPTEFTDRELDIMGVLWRAGSGTVAEVREALDTQVRYTTVLKLLQILEEKGAVRHESEGRAYRYFPLTGAEAAGGPALRRLLDTVFAGSAELALARLVSEAEPTAAELARMRRLLDELAEDGAETPGDPGDRGAP